MITDATWKLACHFSGNKEHGLMYKSNYKGYSVTYEIVTKKKHGKFGKEKRMFYADNFKENFNNFDDLKHFIDQLILMGQALDKEL